MIRTGLKNIPLNDDALKILKEAEWFVQDDNYKSVKLTCANMSAKDADRFVSEDYLDEIMAKGRGHDGFPEQIKSYSFGTAGLKFVDSPNIERVTKRVNEKLTYVIETLAHEFTLKKNALFSVYPPGGFISWHNNANAPAYNFIFTWSENGDGWFKWWDMNRQKIVTIPDVPGWQCKAGYFGPYARGNEGLCYHAARTNCLRMTIAFTLTMEEISIGLQDWIIEDISS